LRWLQYLAKISYSLYLIHYPVSHVLTWFGWQCFDNSPTPLQGTLILTGCLVVSIAAAHVLYMTVERPSVRLADRLKRS
jgi:peptidoglycan/LPS O-acetylase OafA/YrhL